MNLLFLHPDSKSYDARSLRNGPLGGTEATIIRVSEGLAARGHTVTVRQGGRMFCEVSDHGVRYEPYDYGDQKAYDHIVLLDVEKLLPKTRRRYSHGKLYLWVHCFPGKRRRKRLALSLRRSGAELIAVSETQKEELLQHMITYPAVINASANAPGVNVQFNPVDDTLTPNDVPVDPRKMVFLSSPHKGLWMVLKAFTKVREEYPDMQLYIADPGYMKGYQQGDLPEGVVRIGSRPHAQVMNLMRSAFCLFYPQSFFRETFGLVFAEANALGTPVIAHPIGAAREVLGSEEQLVDADDHNAVVERIKCWLKYGRPAVTLSTKFRLTNVLDSWEAMCGKQDRTYSTTATINPDSS